MYTVKFRVYYKRKLGAIFINVLNFNKLEGFCEGKLP